MAQKIKSIELWIKWTVGIGFGGYTFYQYYENHTPPNQWLMVFIGILIIGNMQDVVALISAIRGNNTNNNYNDNNDEIE